MARRHTEEFRRQAVRTALTSGLSCKQEGSDLGVGFSTFAKWTQKSRPDDLPPSVDIDLARENERLSKEDCLLLAKRKILNENRTRK